VSRRQSPAGWPALIKATILRATNDRLRTFVQTDAGELSFQEWFVRRGHRDEVTGVRFEGAETARPAPGVLEAIDAADLIVIAPSNPFVSIGPVLAVRKLGPQPTRSRLRRKPPDRPIVEGPGAGLSRSRRATRCV
jgi:LPPG:FO 2-phospho-L-lactate transferase